MEELIVKAPAKINLTLDVLRKRSDGYHELETVMHQINLIDKIYLKKETSGIKVDSNSRLIPLDNQNLVYKAAEAIFSDFQIKEGIRIFIEKLIPVGAGLAGGSTDAAAVLTGINSLYDLGACEDVIMQMAASIGSDVPFCVKGGTALARGRGEILKPLDTTMNLSMVLIKPDFQLSTAEVYKALDLNQVEIRPNNTAFLEAWKNCDIIGVAKNMANVLENISLKKNGEIALIKKRLLQLGALNAMMSGSGPSVFGIFNDNNLLQNAYEILKQDYNEVYLVSSYI
jgi:4-diphosphocytidyl-2-C-methyl-D-erythritol kinase